MQRMTILGIIGDYRVPPFVIGGDEIGLFVRNPRLPLRTHQHFVSGRFQMFHAHAIGPVYGSSEGKHR